MATQGLQQENIGLNKGIVRTPSMGEAGELSECVNLIARHGELENIQPPVETEYQFKELPENVDDTRRLRYIHTTGKYIAYIYQWVDEIYADFWDKDAGEVVAQEYLITTIAVDEAKIVSCGNVLAIYGEGLNTEYYLLKGTEYEAVSMDYGVNAVRLGLKSSWHMSRRSITFDTRISEVDTAYGGEKELIYSDYVQTETHSQAGWQHTLGVDVHEMDMIRIEVLDSDMGEVRFTVGIVNEYAQSAATSSISSTDPIVYSGEHADFKITASGAHKLFPYVTACKEGTVVDSGSAKVNVYRLTGATLDTESQYVGGYAQLMAQYNAFHTRAKEINQFSLPFFARYAFRLSTGEIVSPSAPILMRPSENVSPTIYGPAPTANGDKKTMYVAGPTSTLRYRIPNGLKLPSMVESMVIGVTLPIHPVSTDGAATRTLMSTRSGLRNFVYADSVNGVLTNTDATTYAVVEFPETSDTEEDRMTSTGTFRVIKEIDVEDIVADGTWTDIALDTGKLVSIEGEVSSDMLITDDTSMVESYRAKTAFTYNNRLSFASLDVVYRPGYDLSQMAMYVPNGTLQAGFCVTLDKTDGAHQLSCGLTEITQYDNLCGWFYYPDLNASKATLYHVWGSGSTATFGKAELTLKRHPYLNGAYYYGAIPWEQTATNEWLEVAGLGWTSREENKYITSALNQPLVPDSITGYIGSGEILAVSNATKALTHGQFGQFPLQFFCSDGIWAISIGSDGSYETTNPVSRDVLINAAGLAQTDGAIVFPTAHGFKLLQGQETRTLSTDVHGFNVDESAFYDVSGYTADAAQFMEQIAQGETVYDYVNQLLHVFFGDTAGTHYVYSMESGQWSKQWIPELGAPRAIVAGYPYTTMQFGSKLYQYRSEVSDEMREGFLLTRPLTLGSPLTRKALWDLRALMQRTSAQSGIRIRVFYSQDNVHWYRLRSLKGNSAKYFRLFVQTKMADTDTLQGIAVQYMERYTGKMR